MKIPRFKWISDAESQGGECRMVEIMVLLIGTGGVFGVLFGLWFMVVNLWKIADNYYWWLWS